MTASIKFGTDGWRAPMYDQFTLEPVRLVVQAISDHVRKHDGEERGIVIGYDARFFSDRFAEEAASVLAGNGIKVFTFGRDLPTPVAAFAVREYGAFGAIMFTASHNPPEYNGIKFIPEYAGPASPAITAEIEAHLARRQSAGGPFPACSKAEAEQAGLRRTIDPLPSYFAHLATLVDRAAIASAGLTVIADPMFASGRGLLQDFLDGYCAVETLHGTRDPLFGGMMPDPQAKNLAELQSRVASLPNALGLATDGDADRFGIIDSDGTYLSPNQMIALLLYHLIGTRQWRGIAARTVATTHMVDAVGKAFGVETVETPVGFKYIGELMRARPVIIGGEESGGLSIRGHIPEKDGILACALAAEMRALTGRPLTDTLAELRRQFGGFYTHRSDLHVEPDEKEQLIRSFTDDPPDRVLGRAVVEIRRVDGVKCLLDDGSWFLLRPSGTEALVRAYVEAPEESSRDALQHWLSQAIETRRKKAACWAGFV